MTKTWRRLVLLFLFLSVLAALGAAPAVETDGRSITRGIPLTPALSPASGVEGEALR